ncbi:MAG: cache domain-containing protein [Anaerolineales bacterium]|nr:cache domain-containing protein [Anaerolineales bacterium]
MKLRPRAIFDRLQNVLLISFILVAVVTSVVGIWTTSVVMNNYTERAENERVARDMNLAIAFYEQSRIQLNGAAARLADEPTLAQQIGAAQAGDTAAQSNIEQRMTDELSTIYHPGTHFVLIVDEDGNLVAAYGIVDQGLQSLPATGNWHDFPLLAAVLADQRPRAATEVVDEALLAQIGLAEKAYIPLKETPKANPEPFDPREGSAGLAQIACAPVLGTDREAAGAVLAGHLFNNDFTLVDRIQAVAGVDTATIFFGDLRVSTNVRENDERAIGTRVSQAVFDTVLRRGEPFTGIAYVVNEWFITRYVPLLDHRGEVVGSLYVGARRATFIELQHTLTINIALVALVAIVPAALLALPIARLTTHPLEEMARASRQVAQGNTHIRVPTRGVGEVTILGQAFNTMLAELEEAQTQLIHKERLASMGQLAAGVAHQLNNPLGTILLFSDIVLQDLPEGAQGQEEVQMIAQEARRAKEIVTALLNFARQQKVWAQPTALDIMLHEFVERSRQQPAYERIQIVEQIAPDLPQLEVDPVQLSNVFVNLMDNAADAMPEGGTLTIRANLSPDRQSVMVRIKDTGCGIPPENIKHIFSPFFTTKPLGQGTGLGLSIAYGIVKMHHGAIKVESQVGEGTTFTVTLPVRLPKSDTQASLSEEISITPGV